MSKPRFAASPNVSKKSAAVVGQVGNLRPIVNRPLRLRAQSKSGGLPTARRIPSCPTSASYL